MKRQYLLTNGDFDLTEIFNVVKIYFFGISDNCIIPPATTSLCQMISLGAIIPWKLQPINQLLLGTS